MYQVLVTSAKQTLLDRGYDIYKSEDVNRITELFMEIFPTFSSWNYLEESDTMDISITVIISPRVYEIGEVDNYVYTVG